MKPNSRKPKTRPISQESQTNQAQQEKTGIRTHDLEILRYLPSMFGIFDMLVRDGVAGAKADKGAL